MEHETKLGVLSDKINTVCEAALFASLVLMAAVTILQIIFRMFFDALTWSEEMTCFLLVLASFLGTAVAFKRGAHISVTLVIKYFPLPIRKLAALFSQLVGIFFFGVVARYGTTLSVNESYQVSPALEISMFWIYMILPVCSAIVLIHLSCGIERILKGGNI